MRRALAVALVVLLAGHAGTAEAGGKIITLADNLALDAGLDLPPVDVGRFSHIFVLGFAPSGEAQLSIHFSAEAVTVGEPGAKTSVGKCKITSISAACDAGQVGVVGVIHDGFPVGGPFLAIRANPNLPSTIFTLKIYGMRR